MLLFYNILIFSRNRIRPKGINTREVREPPVGVVHGEFTKALPWYEKASDSAPDSFEKALAFSSLGYVHESLGKPTEALQSFQKALNLGEGSLKGDLLMGVARSYEAVHDSANARSTYDKILTELPNTEYAKSAELFKDQLQ